jgi:hypothetical protein
MARSSGAVVTIALWKGGRDGDVQSVHTLHSLSQLLDSTLCILLRMISPKHGQDIVP